MTENTNNTNTTGNGSNITRPCSVWTMINEMAKYGWAYVPGKNKKGQPIRQAHKYTCPDCQAKRVNEGKSKTLADRSSRNVVVFFKKDRPRVALCHVCNYKHKEGEKASPPEGGVTAPPADPVVQNACLGCGKILPNMKERYCSTCQKRVEKGAPRDSFGRFICGCGKVLPKGRKAKCHACSPPRQTVAPVGPTVGPDQY